MSAIDVDDQEVIVAGHYSGSVDCGGGWLDAGEENIFLCRLNRQGGHLWSKSFGAEGYDNPEAVHVDSDGTILLLGIFEGGIDLGGGLIQGQSDRSDLFIARFTAQGDHIWSSRLTATARYSFSKHLGTDADGNILLTTDASQPVGSGWPEGMVLAKLSPTGEHIWSREIEPCVDAMAVRSDGGTAVAGYFSRSADLGGATLTTEAMEGAYYTANFNGDGDHLWSDVLEFEHTSINVSLTLDPDDEVILSVPGRGIYDFGNGPMEVSPSRNDAVVAKLAGDNGSYLWSSRVQGTRGDSVFVHDIASDRAGVAITGTLSSSIFSDVLFAAKYSSDGTQRWLQIEGVYETTNNRGHDVAIDSAGRVVVAGIIQDEGFVAVFEP